MANLVGSTVWVLIIRDEAGVVSVTLHATDEGARRELADYCYDHWNDREQTAGFPRPEEDRDALIGMYFRLLEDFESYILEGRAVGV